MAKEEHLLLLHDKMASLLVDVTSSADEDQDCQELAAKSDDQENSNSSKKRSMTMINIEDVISCPKEEEDHHRKNQGNKKSYHLLSSFDVEDDDDEEELAPFFDEDEDDSTSSVGKVLIFKPNKRGMIIRRRRSCLRRIMFCILLMTTALLSFALIHYHGDWFSRIFSSQEQHEQHEEKKMTSQVFWRQKFPFLTIESAFRFVTKKSNNRSFIIIPFGTGIDASFYPKEACDLYFAPNLNYSLLAAKSVTTNECGGGIMALNPKDGQVVWSLLSQHELFALNCAIDVTDDGMNDCFVGGRMSSMFAVDSSNGRVIWRLKPMKGIIDATSNFYTPLLLPKDVDGDGLKDLLLVNGGDPLRSPKEPSRLTAHLLIVSSVSGRILKHALVPDFGESYYSPQIIDDDIIIIGTGGETRGGALFQFSLQNFLQTNRLEANAVLVDDSKGFLTPPLFFHSTNNSTNKLTNHSKTKTKDLIMIMNLFNSSVVALNTSSSEEIWRTSFPGSESYSTPTIARFFGPNHGYQVCVQRSFGPGFPVYTHAQTIVLDAKSGKILSLLDSSLVGVQSSPLTVVSSFGEDYFVFWRSSCYDSQTGKELPIDSKPYSFAEGTSIHESSRADFCAIRFAAKLVTQLIAANNHSRIILYDSRDFYEEEHEEVFSRENLIKNWRQRNALQAYQEDLVAKQQEDQDVDGQMIPLLESESVGRKKKRQIMMNNNIKRHVGVHSADGVQRVIATPVLLPPTSLEDDLSIVFGVFWIPPSKVAAKTPEMTSCIQKYTDPEVEARVRIKPALDLDHDAYESAINEICAKETGFVGVKTSDDYDLLNKRLGSMTVYRVSLKERPEKLAPFHQQVWREYLGNAANSVAQDFPVNN